MKFTKTLKYSAAALVASLGLVGCGNQETETKVELVTNTGDGVNVEFWHNMSGAFAETIDSIVSDFNSTIGAEKGITVHATYQGSYDDLKAKTMAAIKAGNSPHIVQGTVNNIHELIQSEYIQDLTDYINHPEIGFDYEDIFELLERTTSIEPRACNIFVKEDKKREFKELFNEYFKDDFLLLTKSTIILLAIRNLSSF